MLGFVLSRRRPVAALFGAALLGGTALSPARAQSTGDGGSGTIALGTLKVKGAGQSPTGPGRGYVATRSATGTKTDAKIIEVPQSISVVTAAQMQAQGAQSVSAAMRYTAGVQDEIYGAGTRADWMQIRGFDGYDAYYLDGLHTDQNRFVYELEPYGLSRLEVLKGPASVLYGANAPGGMIDAVSKRPTDTPQHQIQLTGGSYGDEQLNLDGSGPVAGTDGKLDYRLVGVFRKSGTQVDHTSDNRQYIAPSLTWKIDPDDTLTVLASYLRERSAGNTTPYLTAAGTLYPSPYGQIKTSIFPGDPGFDHENYNEEAIGYDFTHRFSDALKFVSDFRYSWLQGDEQLSYGTGTDAADPQLLDRELYAGNANVQSVTTDNHLEYNFNTGALHHDVIVGVDIRHEVSKNQDAYGDDTPINLFNPSYPTVNTASLTPADSDNETLNQAGLYGQDEMAWRHWRLLFGVRHDFVSDNEQEKLAATSADQQSEATTYRTGLVYLFDNGLAPYVSYATSFDPVSGVDAQGAPYKPTKGEQEEVGVKYQPPGVNAFITASLFNLTETNVQTTNPTNPLFSVQTGEDRNQGLELEGKANLAAGLDVDASYTYNNSEILKDNSGYVGNQMPLVPRHQIALWGHYTMQHGPLTGLGLGAGWRYRSSIYGDTANQYRMTPISLFDLAADYDLGRVAPRLRGMKAQVNAANVGDVKYLATCLDATDCYWGERRTVYVTLSYDF